MSMMSDPSERVALAAAMDEDPDEEDSYDEPAMEYTMRVLEERELTEDDIGHLHERDDKACK